jgi:hypothetical protein
MNRAEKICSSFAFGLLALGAAGGIETGKNWGAQENQSTWKSEQTELSSEIVSNIPQNFSQATQEDQAKIDDLRRQLSTVTREISANKGSANADELGFLLLAAGGLSGLMLMTATSAAISNRKYREGALAVSLNSR